MSRGHVPYIAPRVGRIIESRLRRLAAASWLVPGLVFEWMQRVFTPRQLFRAMLDGRKDALASQYRSFGAENEAKDMRSLSTWA